MATKKKLVYASTTSVEDGDERLRSYLATLTGELHDYSSRCTLSDELQFALDRFSCRAPKRCLVSSGNKLAEVATDSFLRTNEEAGSVDLNLDKFIASDASHFIRVALERFTSAYDNSGAQSSLSISLLLSLWRFGPGASALTFKTHFADKIRLDSGSVTERALRFAMLLRKVDPHLNSCDAERVYGFRFVEGSSLSTVPKNEETHRTIGTEPLWNMALQLAAGSYMEGALRRVGLDITRQQDINKRLAGIGSTDGSLATIDLKSASDMITPELIKLLWPPEWYALLMTIRSERIKIRGEWVNANMMSTMGNGFTFPMMTLTLLALVYATQSYRSKKPMFWDRNTTAVFGDDIICPTEDFERVCTTLTDAGLIVNTDKSFSDGPFRESCGGDYYYGYDVTPIYVKELCSDPEVYTAINQVLLWCAKHHVALPRTIEYLVGLLYDPSRPFLVPLWADAYSGIRTSAVGRRYAFWKVQSVPRTLNFDKVNQHIAMKIALGGYVTSTRGSNVVYTPRPAGKRKPKYVLERARLPRGYLDGSDSGIRSAESQQWINAWLLAIPMSFPTTERREAPVV